MNMNCIAVCFIIPGIAPNIARNMRLVVHTSGKFFVFRNSIIWYVRNSTAITHPAVAVLNMVKDAPMRFPSYNSFHPVALVICQSPSL